MTAAPEARVALTRLLTAGLLQQVVALVGRLRIPDAVAEEPRSVAELADRTGMPAPTLGRLLRAATALDVLTSEGGDRYGLGPLGEHLLDRPASLLPQAELLSTPALWAAWGALDHAVATGESSFGHVNGAPLFELAAADEELAASSTAG